jgi:DNA-binding NarL/FixJ family response regulator
MSNIELVGTSDKIEGTLHQMNQTLPNLIILDMKLKDGIGLNLLIDIKKSKLKTKVAVFTMFEAFEIRCRNAGCDYFFDKSKDFEELQNLIKHMAYRYTKKKRCEN